MSIPEAIKGAQVGRSAAARAAPAACACHRSLRRHSAAMGDVT